MKIICAIPARYESSRFPGKPLVEIGGKTIIQRVCEQAGKSRHIEEIYVATDSDKIFAIVKAFGGNPIMTSPDEPSGTDRIAAAVKGMTFDIVVNIQGDEPFIHPDNIDRTIEAMLNDDECMISTPKIQIASEEDYLSPHAVKVVTDVNGYALYFSRSPIPNKTRLTETAPEHHSAIWGFKHLGMYVYRHRVLEEYKHLNQTPLEKTERLEQLRLLENGYKIKVVQVTHDSIGIDTPEDLERAAKTMGF